MSYKHHTAACARSFSSKHRGGGAGAFFGIFRTEWEGKGREGIRKRLVTAYLSTSYVFPSCYFFRNEEGFGVDQI